MYIKEMPSPSPFNIMPKAFSPLINKIQEAIFKIKTVAINKISFAPPSGYNIPNNAVIPIPIKLPTMPPMMGIAASSRKNFILSIISTRLLLV